MRAQVIVNGQTILDNTIEPGQPQPPEFLAKLINPTAKREPHLMCAGLTLANAIMTNTDTTIAIQTHTTGWQLAVHHTQTIEAHAGQHP
jgi:hypothetical protein